MSILCLCCIKGWVTSILRRRKMDLQINLNTAGLLNSVKTQIDPVMQQTMLDGVTSYQH
jgi:hypothetical protein